MSLYEEDAYLFYTTTAQLLREKKFDKIDIENAAEELESMGKSEEAKLESFFVQLFMHLLKWKYQPEKNYDASWETSIKKQRRNAKKHLGKNPSLKGHLNEIVESAYETARYDASLETHLKIKIFPEEMPFTLQQALDDDWLPETSVKPRLLKSGI